VQMALAMAHFANTQVWGHHKHAPSRPGSRAADELHSPRCFVMTEPLFVCLLWALDRCGVLLRGDWPDIELA